MNVFTEKISKTVFTRTADWNFAEIKINNTMIDVLSLLDGHNRFAQILNQLNISEKQMVSTINKLYKLKLIEVKNNKSHQETPKTSNPEIYKSEQSKPSRCYRGVVF